MTDYRIFRGDATKQLDVGGTEGPADPHQWYYEPTDYEGDALWSRGYATEYDADTAALLEFTAEDS